MLKLVIVIISKGKVASASGHASNPIFSRINVRATLAAIAIELNVVELDIAKLDADGLRTIIVSTAFDYPYE